MSDDIHLSLLLTDVGNAEACKERSVCSLHCVVYCLLSASDVVICLLLCSVLQACFHGIQH